MELNEKSDKVVMDGKGDDRLVELLNKMMSIKQKGKKWVAYPNSFRSGGEKSHEVASPWELYDAQNYPTVDDSAWRDHPQRCTDKTAIEQIIIPPLGMPQFVPTANLSSMDAFSIFYADQSNDVFWATRKQPSSVFALFNNQWHYVADSLAEFWARMLIESQIFAIEAEMQMSAAAEEATKDGLTVAEATKAKSPQHIFDNQQLAYLAHFEKLKQIDSIITNYCQPINTSNAETETILVPTTNLFIQKQDLKDPTQMTEVETKSISQRQQQQQQNHITSNPANENKTDPPKSSDPKNICEAIPRYIYYFPSGTHRRQLLTGASLIAAASIAIYSIFFKKSSFQK
jgi:hypothetical protein